ncbi:MAG: hypothetical protein AAB214_00935, partial [Fibrobacterota bacterium]
MQVAQTQNSDMLRMALESGIEVTPGQVRQRQILKAAISGGDTLPFHLVRAELLEQSFFASIALSTARESELGEAWDSLRSKLPAGARIAYADALPLLEAQVLSSKAENTLAYRRRLEAFQGRALDSLIRKEEEIAEKGEDAPDAASPRMLVDGSVLKTPSRNWTIREIQVRYPERVCIAWDSLERRCVLSAGDFNLQALSHS